MRFCVFLQDRLRVMCVSLEDRVCVWWQSVSPVWSLCSLCSLSSDTLCSQATPLVAHWTLRDTPTANPKGAFTGMHQRDTARSAPLKAFKLIFVSLTASFFFYLLHAVFRTQFGLIPTLAVCFKALKSWIPAKCGLAHKHGSLAHFFPHNKNSNNILRP